MKTKSIFVLASLFLCIFSSGMANGDKDFKAEVSDQNTFILKFQNPEEQKIRVSFMDLNGVTLHEKLCTQSKVDRMYDLKNLPQGSYMLVVENDDLIHIQPITKTEDVLLIDESNLQTILPPQIDFSSSSLDVKMNLPSGTRVSVQMEDNFGHVLYRGDLNPEQQLKSRFDLNELGAGDYYFSVFIEGDVFDHAYTENINVVAAR